MTVIRTTTKGKGTTMEFGSSPPTATKLCIGGLNNCQSIAMNHGIALDTERDRIYARELVDHRITVADLAGTVIARIEEIRANSLAIDPKTGDLWCLIDNGSIDEGAIIVVDNKGIKRGRMIPFGAPTSYSIQTMSRFGSSAKILFELIATASSC